MLLLLLPLATAHLPKLEYPVKRNENRSNQAENTHTQGAALSHIDMQMNVTILNEIIVLNEGRTAAAPARGPIPIPNPSPDSDSDPQTICFNCFSQCSAKRKRKP